MTSPVSLPAGSDLLASDFDAYENLTGAWTAYTPTWTTSGVAPALGNGTLSGKYMRAGSLVVASLVFVAGSTSTFGTGEFRFGLPVASGLSFDTTGSAVLLDSGTTRYTASCLLGTGLSYVVIIVGSSNAISATVPMTWTTSDQINLQILYQA